MKRSFRDRCVSQRNCRARDSRAWPCTHSSHHKRLLTSLRSCHPVCVGSLKAVHGWERICDAETVRSLLTRAFAQAARGLTLLFSIIKKPVARIGWMMETDPERHIQRVKNRLQAGRLVLIDLHEGGHWRAADEFEGIQIDS